jgi:hypothetical protein
MMPMADRKKTPVTRGVVRNDAQADNDELGADDAAGLAKKIKGDEEEVERYVREREQSIGRGVRRAGKRFRL